MNTLESLNNQKNGVEMAAQFAARLTVDAIILGTTRLTPGPYVGIGLVTIRVVSSVARNNPRTDFSSETIFSDTVDAVSDAF